MVIEIHSNMYTIVNYDNFFKEETPKFLIKVLDHKTVVSFKVIKL